MSATAPRRAPSAVTLTMLAAPIVAAAVLAGVSIDDVAVASPSTTVVTTTTAPATSSTRPPTTSTAVPTTTQAGPPPRGSRRVAAPVDIEKIRPTSLPLRTLAIATGALIVALAVAGFVYGKLRSQVPSAPRARPATAGDGPSPPVEATPVDATPVDSPPLVTPQAAALPPPKVQPLPPPDVVSEWAPPNAENAR
jgi:hypothetical protein